MKVKFKLIISIFVAINLMSSLTVLAKSPVAQKLAPSRLARCTTKQASIQKRLRHVDGQLIKAMLQGEKATTKIKAKARRGTVTPALLAEVKTQHDKLRNDLLIMRSVSSFSCSSAHPKTDLDQFKAATKSARRDLVGYVKSVQKLSRATE